MVISICLDDDFVSDVKVYVDVVSCSVLKQIEYWVKIGCIVEDNFDLFYSLIFEFLLV